MYRIKITSKGQVTLPKLLREKLELREGGYLDASIQNNTLVLKPVPTQNGKEVIVNYCKKQAKNRSELESVRKILAKVPFSLSERVETLREEN